MFQVTIKVAGPFASGKTTLLLKYFDAMRAVAGKEYDVRIRGEFKAEGRHSSHEDTDKIRDELIISIEFGSDALEILEIETTEINNPENKRIYTLVSGPGHKSQWQALVDLWNQYKPDIFYVLVDGSVLAKYLDTYEDFKRFLRVEVWSDYLTPEDIKHLTEISGCVGILVNKRDLLENRRMLLAYMEDYLSRFVKELSEEFPQLKIHYQIISLRNMDTYKNPMDIVKLPCTPYIRLILAKK